MATFYLLPSPGYLGKALKPYLQVLFPGLHWDESILLQLTERVRDAASQHADAYVVYQHELPEDADVVQAIVDAYGAEPGDEVIEIHACYRIGGWRIRRRRVAA
jgi:hypothetical protein